MNSLLYFVLSLLLGVCVWSDVAMLGYVFRDEVLTCSAIVRVCVCVCWVTWNTTVVNSQDVGERSSSSWTDLGKISNPCGLHKWLKF